MTPDEQRAVSDLHLRFAMHLRMQNGFRMAWTIHEKDGTEIGSKLVGRDGRKRWSVYRLGAEEFGDGTAFAAAYVAKVKRERDDAEWDGADPERRPK